MVEGMEAIVATVSGYHGSERLKLIQLINAAGANYVGKMTKSTTHLICRKFDGEKYELAKKFGTMVVNHRWLEDCMKEGKRIPEHPYTLISGQEAGFIKSDLSVVMEQAAPLKENNLILNKQNMHERLKNVIDLDSDEIENDDFDELLLNENSSPKPERVTTGRPRTKRKVVKENSRGDWRAMIDNIGSIYEAEVHTLGMFQNEESDLLPNFSNKQTRRNIYTSTRAEFGEPSRKSRRLIKKKAKSGTTTRLATNNAELQSRTLASNNDDLVAASPSNELNELRDGVEASISSRHVTTSCAHGESRHNMNHMEEINPVGDAGIRPNDKSDADARDLDETGSDYQNIEGQPESKDLTGNFAGLQKSVELSCVICWTEFSSTRGALPCGHRFCFSCIQNWSDHMASNRKKPTCPLCKASFESITRVGGAATVDQKIYSQTVPCASSSQDIFLVPEAASIRSNTQNPLPSVCCHCQSPYPADLLIYCQTCQSSCIHSYCLDPPLFPWTCVGCRDRRLFYLY